jgi:hypothetical protein
MIPNAINKEQMFSQVTNTSAIWKYVIHRETIGEGETFAHFLGIFPFLLEHDPDFRPIVVSSYNELSLASSMITSDTSPNIVRYKHVTVAHFLSNAPLDIYFWWSLIRYKWIMLLGLVERLMGLTLIDESDRFSNLTTLKVFLVKSIYVHTSDEWTY